MHITTAFSIVLVLALIGFGVFVMRGDTAPKADYTRKAPAEEATLTTSPTPMDTEWNINAQGLGIQIVKRGSGPAAQVGSTVTVHYVGTLEDGTKFDSSIDRGQPFSFTLGEGRVIAGWEQGVLGMQVGEQRNLNIPAELGYGAAGAGGVIPPNATLLFTVELLDIQP